MWLIPSEDRQPFYLQKKQFGRSRVGGLGVGAAWVVGMTDSGPLGGLVVPCADAADWVMGCIMVDSWS